MMRDKEDTDTVHPLMKHFENKTSTPTAGTVSQTKRLDCQYYTSPIPKWVPGRWEACKCTCGESETIQHIL